MGHATGAVLPLAIGVALSPVPIIATILLLLSPRARTTGIGFALGWVLGILTTVVVFLLVAAVIPQPTVGGSRPVSGAIHLLLGIALLGLSARQFRTHTRRGEQAAELPSWMRTIDRFGFWDSLGLGVLLAAVNPKNLLLGAAAGIALGTSAAAVGDAVIAIVVYLFVAASTILLPVVGFVIAADRLERPLDRLRTWLERENTVIMGMVLLILGVVLLAKGIGYF